MVFVSSRIFHCTGLPFPIVLPNQSSLPPKLDGFFEDLYHHVHDNTTSNIDLDNLTIGECISIFENDGLVSVINDGKLMNLEENKDGKE